MNSETVLGDVLLGIESGKSFQTGEAIARANELGVLKVSAVSWSAFKPDEAKLVLNHHPSEHHRVKAGDLLISRANTRELVGAVVLVDHDYPLRLLSDKTLRLIVNTDCADKAYLLFALRSAKAREHIEGNATGTSDSMRNISQGVIASTPIVLPALADQRRIAARLKAQLAAVEQARQAAQAQLCDVRQLTIAVVSQAFGGVGEAEPTVLGDAIRIDATIVDPTTAEVSSLPHINGENIRPLTGELSDVRSAAEDGMTSGKYKFDAGDVLYSKLRPYLRKAAIVDFAGLCSADMYPIKVDAGKLDARYLRALLVSEGFTEHAIEASARSRMPKLNREQLFAYEFELPSLATQKRIAIALGNRLSGIEQLRAAAQAQLADIEALPARLLAQAFDSIDKEVLP